MSNDDPMCQLQLQDPAPKNPNINQYTPIVQMGPLVNMPKDDITVVTRATVLFSYADPANPNSPPTVLELRNPELNDQMAFQAYRVQRYSRGNTQIMFRDPYWFKTRVFNWAFTALTKQNTIDILDFLQLTAGRWINVTDYFGRTFNAIIINPDNPITQEKPDYDQVAILNPDADAYPYSPLKGSGYTWKVDLQKALV
jgi:hypothetical protein